MMRIGRAWVIDKVCGSRTLEERVKRRMKFLFRFADGDVVV